MTFIIPLIIFLCLNVYPVYFMRLSFGKAFPSVLFFSTLIIYLFGFINNLRLGYYFLVLLAIIGLFIFIYNRKNKDFFNRYFTISFYVAVLIFAFTLLLQITRHFSYIDEFAHLGFMAKEAYRLNAFYIVSESNMWINKDYPPFFTLFQVLWFFMKNGMKEKYCYQALTFFELSLFLPLIETYFHDIKKEFIKICLFILSFILLGLIIGHTNGLVYYTLVYNSIYIDWPIAYLLGYSFYHVLTMNLKDSNDFIILVLALSSLIISKQISIALWLLASVLLLFRCMINKQVSFRLLYLLIPLAFYVSWDYIIAINNLSSKFSFKDYNFLIIIDYFKKTLPSLESSIISNFLDAIVNRGIIIKPLSLSYVLLVIIIGALIFAYGFINKDNKKDSWLLALFYIGGAVGYAYALMLSYVHDFGYLEGPSLAMFDRYALMYILAGIVLLFMMYSNLIKKNYISLISTCVLILLCTQTSTITNSIPNLPYSGFDTEATRQYVSLVNNMKDDEELVVIWQNDVLKKCALQYYLDSNKDIFYLDISYPEDERAYDTGTPYSKDDFLRLLNDYDYIYISDYEYTFYKQYWKTITDEELIIDRMYHIIYHDESNINFVPLN